MTDNGHPQGPQQVADFVSVFGPNGRKIIQHGDLMSYTSLTPMEHDVNYIVIYTYYRRIHEIAIFGNNFYKGRILKFDNLLTRQFYALHLCI